MLYILWISFDGVSNIGKVALRFKTQLCAQVVTSMIATISGFGAEDVAVSLPELLELVGKVFNVLALYSPSGRGGGRD
jgi:hypothetical protein